jgi:hypothetical protein
MNDDYLWDKTGPPAPQIQQLEEILGTLRYQPRPLKLPKRRNYLPWLAIAASLLFAILAGGIWLRTRSQEEIPPQQVKVAPPASVIESAPNPPPALAKHTPRHRSAPPAATKEALVAKEQLMVALRLASEKLNMVHRINQIKNQHRIG